MTRAAAMRLVLLLGASALGSRAPARGQELHLFSIARTRAPSDVSADTAAVPGTIEPSPPWNLSESGGFSLGIEGPPGIGIDADEGEPASSGSSEPAEPPPTRPPQRRCVLIQCQTLPIAPAPELFTTGVTIWTVVGLLGGIADGIEGPIHYGVHPFSFTDESYFQRWTYGGGSDKASHFVVSTHVAGLAYDAYRLNGLSEDQSFGLALATSIVAGAFVEIGDGLSPYGFSAQDWTSDALGSLASVFIKRAGLDDTLGFSLGRWLQTTIPPPVIDGRPLFGIDYSQEIYTMNVRFSGLLPRVHADPGFARFFQFSFAYLTKGFGYQPPLDTRYQEVGFELGLDFQEILKAVGVSNQTWWGDTLLRIFGFLRLPYTQVGAYYNLFNHKWYGPGAPYSFY
jgi:hypothetical protein